MCAQFVIRSNVKKLARILGVDLVGHPDLEWNEVVLPHSYSPVLVAQESAIKVMPMKFALLPAWSQEPRVKFATHNARLESVDKTGKRQYVFQKPTWKVPFLRHHCLVPVEGFIEPIYRGEFAGHMVKFEPEQGETLFAAGIWDRWTSKETGEVIESFAILTDDPLVQVKQVGHDRSPLFLDAQAGLEWLKLEGSGEEQVEFLKNHKLEFSVKAESFRRMKPGWEKRA